MLKIRTQLDRALRYQSTLATERRIGHFDDAAKDLSGPSSEYRESLRERRAQTPGTVPSKLRTRRDAATGRLVGYYDADGD